MRDELVKYQKETGNIYNLEATPAKSCGYRMAQLDKKKYSDIINSVGTEAYYTGKREAFGSREEYTF